MSPTLEPPTANEAEDRAEDTEAMQSPMAPPASWLYVGAVMIARCRRCGGFVFLLYGSGRCDKYDRAAKRCGGVAR